MKSSLVQSKQNAPGKAFSPGALVSDERRTKRYADAIKEKVSIKIHRLDDECMEFDLSGVDASLANAFRKDHDSRNKDCRH